MKLNLNLVSTGRMIEGFSYDRGNFYLNHYWARSLVSGLVNTGLVFLATYCVIQMMSPDFAAALGEQAVNFKIAAGALLVGLLSYSLVNLFMAVQADTMTKIRLERVNGWLMNGWSTHAFSEKEVPMKSCQLSMLRCVERPNGMKVYCVASHAAFDKPFLVELMLKDNDFTATGAVYAEPEEIRANITQVCDVWTPTVANLVGIEVNTPDPHLDVEAIDLLEDDAPRFGRASTPVKRERKSKAVGAGVINAG